MDQSAPEPRGPGSSCYHCASPRPPLYSETIEERTGDVVREVPTVVCEQHRTRAAAS